MSKLAEDRVGLRDAILVLIDEFEVRYPGIRVYELQYGGVHLEYGDRYLFVKAIVE